MSPDEGPPVLDRAAADRLTRIGGPALATQMISLFVEHAPRRIGAVRTGLQGGDAAEAERGAHSLKSTAGNLGAERLMLAARIVEEAVVAGNLDAAARALPALETALAEALAALERLQKELNP